MGARQLVFLTGATGFIGSRLVRRLAERGAALRALVRPTSDTSLLEHCGAELVRGDITDAALLEDALRGTDLAYHAAGLYALGVVDEDAMEDTNVRGTAAFLSAVERAGTPRSVYVSTTLALGPVQEGVGDESSEHPGGFRSAYERTKTDAHRLARRAQERGLPLIIVCPANVYGPGDRGPNGAVVADLLAGRVPGLVRPPSWWSYVHVDDVVEGLLLAADAGRSGEVYVLGGEHLSLDEFLERVCALAGRRPPRLRFPVPLVRSVSRVLDGAARLTGLRFPISRERVEMAAGWRFLHSHAKATRELGWCPRPLADGLPETVAWFLEQQRNGRGAGSTGP